MIKSVNSNEWLKVWLNDVRQIKQSNEGVLISIYYSKSDQNTFELLNFSVNCIIKKE